MARQPFPVVAHNKFIGFADGNILSWCPTMDLLAVSMNRMSIWVFRINGERIYSINNKSLILDISWNPNGKFFCVSGIDGYCKIYDSNSGNLINAIGGKLKTIDLINWCCQKSRQNQGKFDNLFKVDVLSSLPKLSLNNDIPSNTNMSNNGSNTNYQLDEINNTDCLLNFLVTVRSNSEISLTFNSSLMVEEIIGPKNIEFLCHANDLNLIDHYFLVKNQDDHSKCLLKMTLNIPISNNLRVYLMEVIIQACKIKSIMSYVSEQLHILSEEVKPFIQLFDRHLSNLKDSLYADTDLTTNYPTEEELKCKVINTLFDLLLTGLIPANLKDYWLNQLGERGIKKLAKLGNSLYDSIRRVGFNQLVSSLDRLLILLNSLQGLTKWLDSIEIAKIDANSYLGLNLESINTIVEMTKNLLKHFYQLIWDINEEQNLFNDFLNWVKIGIIDKISKEDDIDSYYKSLHVNYKTSNLVKYFNEYLFKTKLFNYFEVKLPMNEIFFQDKVETNLIDNYTELNKFLETNLLNSITGYIKSIVEFQNVIPLELFSGYQEKMKIFKDSNCGIISCIDTEQSILTVIKFSLTNSELQKKVVKLEDPIINYEIISEKKLLLLFDSKSKNSLELFDFEEVFTQPQESYPYASIKPINQSTFDESAVNQISKPKYLAVNTDKSRLLGCLLDANKQNYIIFELNNI